MRLLVLVLVCFLTTHGLPSSAATHDEPSAAAPSFLQAGALFPQSLSPLAQHMQQRVHAMLQREEAAPFPAPVKHLEPVHVQSVMQHMPVGALERQQQLPQPPVMMRERPTMFPGFREAEAPRHVYEEAARKQFERAERYAGSQYRHTASANPRRRAAANGRVQHPW